MAKWIIKAAAMSGAISVALGAIGAHTLKNILSEPHRLMWEKAVHYQIFHTFALWICFFLIHTFPQATQAHKRVEQAAYLFLTGIFCFSGSLYLLSTREITGISGSIIGPITPLGGTVWIIAWLLLFFHSKSFFK
ncbi:MAG: DUF423 domain-containing protein [Bacteroidia bacterium]